MHEADQAFSGQDWLGFLPTCLCQKLPEVSTTTFLVVLATVVVFIYAYLKTPNDREASRQMTADDELLPLPPGPARIPLLGNTAMLSSTPLPKVLQALSRIYGDVMSLHIGSQMWVVLSSNEAARLAYVKQAEHFSGRVPSLFMKQITDTYGIGFSDKPSVYVHKKFLIQSLRHFGMGRSKIEQHVGDSLEFVIERFKEQSGCPTDPKAQITRTVADVIGRIIFGPHYKRDDESTLAYLKHMEDFFGNMHRAGLVDVFPFLSYIPGDLFKIGLYKEIKEHWSEFINRQIQLHKDDNLGDTDDARDFIDAFLKKMEQARGHESEKDFTEVQLLHVVMDAYTAGIDSTATVILWALLHVVITPGVQERLADELMEAFPGDTRPSQAGRSRCPYTEAFICEVLRRRPIGPVPAPHRVTSEHVVLKGYHIPKDTPIVVNYWAVQMDTRLWRDPETFDPARFLDPQGSCDPHTDKMFPFSLGRRLCPGEALARTMIFLFLANLVKTFRLGLSPDDDGLVDGEVGVMGFLHAPKPFRLVFAPRSN